jgi:hypothetical protein
MIAHIVLFTPKDGTSAGERRAFATSVLETARAVPAIRRAMIGRSIQVDVGHLREMGHTPYQFAALLEFDKAADLVEYLNHPTHAELGRQFWALCGSTVVVEVEWREAGAWNADDLV